MDAINLDDTIKKLKTFKEYGTYIYVRTFTNNYNGYIASVHEDVFMFKDDEIDFLFPIRFDELKFIPIPSNKKGSDFNNGRRCDG
ncbi:MAG: hypothetical protein WCR04_11250 [Fibrobacteraceae bacterium]